MKSFYQYILESVLTEKAPAPTGNEALNTANKQNTAFGNAYETATVMHLHHATGSQHNPNTEYQAKIKHIQQKHHEAMALLPPKKQEEALSAAKKSAHAYLGSLKDHESIDPEHIHEIHHTNQGISSHIGHHVDRASNPHDILVKGVNAGGHFMHGASLKAKSGTASNNSVAAFEKASELHGLKTDVSSHWNEGKKKAGLSGKSGKEIKELRHDPELIKHNTETQQSAAFTHANDFNNAKHKVRQAHILHFLKASPDLPYHYVVGNKGTSTPIGSHPAVQAIRNSKSLTASVKNNVVHFHNEKGEHVASTEHRTTHGAFSSPQANFKFGTMKAPK